MLCALIMAGGKGTRFWPISTDDKPKQFLNLIGDKTMIQMTYERIEKLIPKERIFICTGKKYHDLVKNQLPFVDDWNIILEPQSRNTSACITLSAMIISRYYKDSNMLVLPSDHLINDDSEFIKKIEIGNEFLEDNKKSILTFGIYPNRAECGYGYIKVENKNIGIKRVESFVEKPDEEKVNEYLKEGNYLWNSGMFLWNTKFILRKIERYIPNTYKSLHSILICEKENIQLIIDKNYKNTDKLSIDYSVLEKDKEIYVIPCDFGWDDIGTWQAVERYRIKDKNENLSIGGTSYIDGGNNIVVSSGKQIIIDGLSDVYIIESKDKIIVGLKKNIGLVKDLKEKVGKNL